jgi:prolyl oligopeptidase
MKINPLFYAFLPVFLFLITQSAQAQFTPPPTEAKPVTDTLHGHQFTDPYRWLEDKKDEKVIEWTKAQHDATVDFINKNFPPMSGLREEIEAYVDRDIIGPMQLIADRQFFSVKKKGDAQSKLYTRIDGEDILIFDPEKIDPSGKSSMTGSSYTKKGEKVAVGIQTKGAEISTYYIIDTKTGEVLGAPVEGLRGFSWTADEKHAYITVRTQEMIDQQIPTHTYLHKIGSDREKDKLVITPKDAKNIAYIYDSRWSDRTFLYEGDFYATHTLQVKKTGSDENPVDIYSSKEFRASPNAIDDKIYFFTNHEAPNFKLMVTDKSKPHFDNWKELYPEKETVLENYDVTPKYLLIQDKKDLVSRMLLHDLNGKFIKEMQLPEIGNVSFVSYNRDVHAVFVGFTTFTSPYKIYRLDPDKLEDPGLVWEVFYQQEIPLDTRDIEAKIEFYTSKDGTRVPIFIIHKKGLERTGDHPTLLYGYGGFNIGISPSFVGTWGMFINRGGVYAIAGIRGGDEYGEQWHQDGMLFKKQNCFDDFIAAAEYLVKEGFTNPARLAIRGGSNGGLLVGAMITQRPDLFKSAVCAVPLLDMVRYHKFLIARYWIPEYGDPDKEEDYRNLLTYSPYHNIRLGVDMPMTLVTAGEYDSRVDPLHAKKFVAAAQNNVGQVNPIMLYMDFDSGHGSGKSTEQTINDLEFQMRFIMRSIGMEQSR